MDDTKTIGHEVGETGRCVKSKGKDEAAAAQCKGHSAVVKLVHRRNESSSMLYWLMNSVVELLRTYN